MRLARREKYLVLGAACFVVIFLVLQFAIFPFFEQRRRIQRGLKSKQDSLQEIMRLRSEFQAYRKSSVGMQQNLTRRKAGFTLFSFLEDAAGKADVKANIKYMKPSVSSSTGPHKESTVDMKLEAITLQQLVDYLYRIESPDYLVAIKRISISETKKEKGYLDAIVQVLTFE